jgi:hypothetical protein
MLVPNWKVPALIFAAGAAAACGSDKKAVPENVATTESALTAGHDDCGRGDPVGLSLWFDNGAVRLNNGTPKTVVLYGDDARYAQEVDITASVDTSTDMGIAPVTQSGDMSRLDWQGVQQVDEDYRPELGSNPPTFTRSRFYRKANWMTKPSVLTITPVDANNQAIGDAIVAQAGSDDKWKDSDDGFIRRFDARQITRGCRAIGDCSGASSFTAQALMQFRDAMHADLRAVRIPANAKRLELFWSADPTNKRYVDVQHATSSQTPYRYGLTISVDQISTPANNAFYVPGETIDFRITYRDGDGNRLHPLGQLPSYADFATDQIASGIRYYDGFRNLLTLYYALKHREGNTIWAFSGPTDKVKYSNHVVTDFAFLTMSGSGIPTATVAENGFSGLFDLLPTVAGTLDPQLSTQPNSDIIHVKVPDDALPGSYTFAFKGRRDWGGEALIQTGTAEVQVGQTTKSVFEPKTGHCNDCHNGPSGFDQVLHRNADRRTCFGCHEPLASEPDHALDYRIHVIHTRSNRVPADPNNCSMCHHTTPTGPARGFPGIGF